MVVVVLIKLAAAQQVLKVLAVVLVMIPLLALQQQGKVTMVELRQLLI